MTHRLWINGQWTGSRGGGTMKIENPETHVMIAQGIG